MMGIGPTDLLVFFTLLWGAVIGALILSRYPSHPVGWLFIVVALCFGASMFSSGYALEAIVFNPDTLPGGEVAAWLTFWLELPGVAALALFLPLLFPDGHLPSPRWRPVAWLGADCSRSRPPSRWSHRASSPNTQMCAIPSASGSGPAP